MVFVILPFLILIFSYKFLNRNTKNHKNSAKKCISSEVSETRKFRLFDDGSFWYRYDLEYKNWSVPIPKWDDSNEPEVEKALKSWLEIEEYEFTKEDFKRECKNSRNGKLWDGTDYSKCSYLEEYGRLCYTCDKHKCINARNDYTLSYYDSTSTCCFYRKNNEFDVEICDYCS